MKIPRLQAAMFGSLLLSMAASAAMTDGEATTAVTDAFDDGVSADAIIQMLVDDGRLLSEATVLAVAAVAGPGQAKMARAGICAAMDMPEAEQVGNAVLDTLNQGLLADQVSTLIETYETTGCISADESPRPPPAYSPSNTGLGGGTDLNQKPGSPSS